MKNGSIWQDVDGNDIQAHGGCIINHKGVYYWYGENKGADNCPGTRRVDVIGISCYSSTDLVNWKYEGLIFESDKTDETSYIHFSKVMERPKVIYNEKNDNFVLWMHIDRADYTYAGVGIAVCDTPTGKFKLVKVTVPNRQDSRDMTIYKDIDGTAYLVHSKDWNKTLNIARLNDSYTDLDGYYVSVLADQEREAPALFYHKGTYYMITSGCTGWDANQALFARCDHILGRWKLIDNPCEGPNARKTFFGQSTYIFEANGKYYLMLDHWQPYDLKKSGYSILPIEIDEKTKNITVTWQEEWQGIGTALQP